MSYICGCFWEGFVGQAVCLGECALDEVYCCYFQRFKIDSL